MLQRISNIVGWLGTALVFGAVAVRFIRPEWAQYAVWGAWAGLGCVVLYTASQWREIAVMFGRRQARYGALASVSVLVVLGILVAVNYISQGQNKRWDLTANKQYSLSDQTVQLLRGLTEPVTFLVFDRPTGFDRYRLALAEYQYHSPQVKPEFIDPDARPVQAREYDVQSYGTVIVEYQGRRERTSSSQEQDLSNALIKVLSPAQQKVYFVQGHGEKSTSNSERDGYSTIQVALDRDNYVVESLALAQHMEVPDDATVVVIAGPTTDLLTPEVDMLRRYLNRGGHLFVLLDPPASGDSDPAGLTALLREWGIDAGQNIVVDASGVGQLFGAGPETPVAATYPAHVITERFNLLTAYPLARSIEPMPSSTGDRVARTIAETSSQSWAETNVAELRASGKVALDEAEGDTPGPVSIAAVVSATAPDAAEADRQASENAADHTEEPSDETRKPETRLAVFGDSDFAANGTAGIAGNTDLFMNTVGWLAHQENLIAIRPKQPSDRRLTMTAEQQSAMMWLTIGIPLALFGTAIYTWSRRR